MGELMLKFIQVAYIWKVCTQRMCLHVPVPLLLLPRPPLPLLLLPGLSEAGSTTETSVMQSQQQALHLGIIFCCFSLGEDKLGERKLLKFRSR